MAALALSGCETKVTSPPQSPVREVVVVEAWDGTKMGVYAVTDATTGATVYVVISNGVRVGVAVLPPTPEARRPEGP